MVTPDAADPRRLDLDLDLIADLDVSDAQLRALRGGASRLDCQSRAVLTQTCINCLSATTGA